MSERERQRHRKMLQRRTHRVAACNECPHSTGWHSQTCSHPESLHKGSTPTWPTDHWQAVWPPAPPECGLRVRPTRQAMPKTCGECAFMSLDQWEFCWIRYRDDMDFYSPPPPKCPLRDGPHLVRLRVPTSGTGAA